ncbi:MAG: outer membrane beta-barrel protein [Bacteroidota bacterium]
MKYLFGFLFLLTTAVGWSQSKPFELQGTLVDDQTEQPLESATIYLEQVRDSSLVTYTISDKNGSFYIKDRTSRDSLRLTVSYIGYRSIQQVVVIDAAEIDLGVLSMQQGETLDEVLIKSRAPITVKKDTLEFNVKSFKTRKDATVEDLLKELPGVEVDPDGQITVNGKPVNKILVNGKPFFSDDPTITTRNLTKELIEKVQVTDTKTDAEAFAGEASDGENKTINLTISEENNKGVFGRLAAGGGTDERYEYAGFFNRFDNDQRLSVLAGGNNTNSPGFSFGEIRGMFGSARSFSVSSGGFQVNGRNFGGGQGITVSNNAGANFSDNFGKGLDLTADYFYANANTEDRSTSERENFLPEGRFFTESNFNSDSDSDSHSANLQFNIKVDSTFLINIAPSFRYSERESRSSSSEISSDVNGQLTNRGDIQSINANLTRNFTNQLDITKRFGNAGSFLKFAMTNEFDSDGGVQQLQSNTEIFDDIPETIVRDQRTDRDTELNSFFGELTYRIPLKAKKLFLDARFHHRDDTRRNVESTFDFDEDTQGYSQFNSDLSTNFRYTNQRTTPSLSLQLREEKVTANIRLGRVFRTLSNTDELRPETTFKRSFEAFEVSGFLSLQFSARSSLYGNYNLNNRPPDLSQLQPFQDVSDPLNVVTGNPNLKPTNSHQVYMGYNNFDFQKGTGYNIFGGGAFQQDQVVARTIVDENFVRNTTYANVNGNRNFWINASFNKDQKLDTIHKLRFFVSLSATSNRSINFNNDVEYATVSNALTPGLRVSYEWKDVLTFIPNYRISYTDTNYDLDSLEDRQFINHNVGIETISLVPKKLEWRNEINFTYNPDVAPGFQRSSWFWNTGLSYSVLKDKGTISLKVFDLLNQNTNARRTSTQNFIQDSESLVLRRYAMLSFSWKFNSLGKKGEVKDYGMPFY